MTATIPEISRPRFDRRLAHGLVFFFATIASGEIGATVDCPALVTSLPARAEYEGPRNAVFERCHALPAADRDLREAEACRFGRVFPVGEVIAALGVANGRADALNVFVDTADPMFRASKWVRFVKRGFTTTHSAIQAWLSEQYPELARAVDEWTKSARRSPHVMGLVESSRIEEWLDRHPEYRKGLLVLPRPSLRNRVGETKSHDAIEAAREYFVEDVAAFFDPRLAETNFEGLRRALVQIAGPRVTSLSQPETLLAIARWVITQFPQLGEVASGGFGEADKDSLTARYGRTLALVPLEWATGDHRSLLRAPLELGTLPPSWEAEVLPRLRAFLTGDASPRTRPESFELIDPETVARRPLRAGDVVELELRAAGPTFGDRDDLANHFVTGTIHAVAIDGDRVAGVWVHHSPQTRFGRSYPAIVEGAAPKFYPIADFEIETSVLRASGHRPTAEVAFDTLRFPEDSGSVTLRLGTSELQAPLSIGDVAFLRVQTAPGTYPDSIQMIVTGFERDAGGEVTALRGYVGRSSNFSSLTRLTRAADGRPVEITNLGGSSQLLAGAFEERTIPLAHILRTDEITRITHGVGPFDDFLHPASPRREPFDHLASWRKAEGRGTEIREDTGDFHLPIGRTAREEAPVAPGDEVLLHVVTPGTLLGFRYERATVTAVVFENGAARGFRGRAHGGHEESTWSFDQIDRHDSYIETNPWDRAHASGIPKAFEKRRAHTPHEETRSGNVAVHAPAWTGEPYGFDEWLERFGLAKSHDAKVAWAYWVFAATPATPKADLAKTRASYIRRFHHDRGGSSKTMAVVNAAWDVLSP